MTPVGATEEQRRRRSDVSEVANLTPPVTVAAPVRRHCSEAARKASREQRHRRFAPTVRSTRVNDGAEGIARHGRSGGRVVRVSLTPRDLSRGTAEATSPASPSVMVEVGEEAAGPARVQSCLPCTATCGGAARRSRRPRCHPGTATRGNGARSRSLPRGRCEGGTPQTTRVRVGGERAGQPGSFSSQEAEFRSRDTPPGATRQRVAAGRWRAARRSGRRASEPKCRDPGLHGAMSSSPSRRGW